MAILFQIGRANRSGEVVWPSPDALSVPEGEWLYITGNVNPPQLTDTNRQIEWQLWRSLDGLTNWVRLGAGTWIGGPDSGQPEVGLPGRVVHGYFVRGVAAIVTNTNFGVTVETR